ncbi:MAG: hypothetical protein WED05_09070 [Candidatus Atabeyarchaeum deiterrae]
MDTKNEEDWVIEVCRIEGICLDCGNSESCPMLAAHSRFSGTLKAIMCMEFRPVLQMTEDRLSLMAPAV